MWNSVVWQKDCCTSDEPNQLEKTGTLLWRLNKKSQWLDVSDLKRNTPGDLYLLQKGDLQSIDVIEVNIYPQIHFLLYFKFGFFSVVLSY